MYIKSTFEFDGMIDGCNYYSNAQFKEITFSDDLNKEHTFNINDIWLVGNGNDYFEAFENETFTGIKVINCCGCFTVAIRK